MAKKMNLSELYPGEKGRVLKIIGARNINKKIVDMGVVPGVAVEIEKVAPLGDPVDVKVKGYHLSLRKEEAEGILVELI